MSRARGRRISPDAVETAPERRECFYAWEIPGALVAVHLRLDVVNRINAAIHENLAAKSERQPEIGGILLGSIEAGDRPVVAIEDFQVLKRERSPGASWTLSPKDRVMLRERLRRRPWPAPLEPVGCFRTHTRPGLYLDEDDFSVFSQFFSNPNQVFLLVRPAQGDTANAGFFLWDEGGVRRQSTYLAFPFDAALLNSGAHPVVTRPPAAPRPAPPSPAVMAMPASVSLLPAGWRLPAAVAATLLAAAALDRWIAPHPARSTRPAPQSMALRVERAGPALRLVWDRESAAVRKASAGIVNISERQSSLRIDLNAQQLASGSIMYFPHSPDITIDMSLRGPAVDVSESVRALIPAADLSPPAPTLEAGAPGHPKPGPPQPAPVRAGSRGTRIPAPLPRNVTVTCKPAPPSRFARIIGRIPLLRALHGNNRGKHFVPAAPLRQIKAVLPPGLNPGALDEPVELRVHIDKAGWVRHTKPLSNSALALKFAADSNEWRFRPARVNDKPVASVMLLKFKFER